MRPKRLISLLVAVCMMITMLPLSAVTAFATDTSTVHEANDDEGIYRYAYKKNEDGETVTITKFLGPVDPTNNGPYVITIPTTLDKYTVTGIGKWAFDRCGLHTLTIEGPIESMGLAAFYECTKLETISFGENIKTIGEQAFQGCSSLTKVTIPDSVTSIGEEAFYECTKLETISFGENIKTNIETIGDDAFYYCIELESVTIPQSVTSIGNDAFGQCHDLQSLTIKDAATSIGHRAFLGCTSLATISLGENIKTIGNYAFASCTCIDLTNVTIPENVTTIRPGTFRYCTHLEYIMLPAGLTSFKDSLTGCPAGNPNGAIYYNNYKTAADALLADNDNNSNIDANDKLRKRNFLYLCKVTFDAKGGKTDYDKVPVYKTEKITETMANDLKATDLDAINHPTRTGYKFTGWYTEDGNLFNVKDTAIMEDINLHAGWEFDPNAPGCHPLTVTGGTVTVKYDGSDVTSKLNSNTDATTGKKTYYVPDNAEVTVTLDKDRTPAGMVFDGWSTGEFSLPQDQNYKAESITFPMSSDVNVSAKYRDAATDHTPDTAVCHPLTVTGGIVTVKNGDKDVTDTLTVTTDETTGKKTYSVPDGATVTVTLDKTLIPEDMVFDIWSTGKFSLPLGQDYKAESITFTMNTMNTMSSDVDIAAQYRDATIEDDGPNVLGTAAIIGTAAVGGAVLGYQAYSLGAEFAGKLMALPYFPSNRSALAMMLWEDAGKPMPESELLYPDVGQEEQDMDLQHAARWAMENELIPDLNDEGTAPEEMKFYPDNAVSKLDVLNAWQKAQELKNN